MRGLRRRGGRSAIGAYRLWVRARDKLFSLAIKGAFAEFGRASVLQLPIRLSGEDRIAIGDRVFVGAGSWLQVLEQSNRAVALTIGDGTSIVGGCVISAVEGVRLGRSVLIARNVYVADHMHAFADRSRPILEQGVTRVGPVEIGDGAWLGENVVVGPGVRIGRGAVVGANSVVLSEVPDYAVAVGAPARIVETKRESAAVGR
jgi:acetyltransferase-like isoleucine patch superfamily enzyme